MVEVTVAAGRSTLQIAEDDLLDLTRQQFNVSPAEATRECVQRRCINRLSSDAACALLDRWTGSDADIGAVHDIRFMRAGELFKARNR